MTLVVAICGEDGSNYMLGDILLSTKSRAEIRNVIQIPTTPRTAPESSHVVTGLTQKIVKIGDGAMLGYACDDTNEAISFIEFLKRDFSQNGLKSLGEAYRDFFGLHGCERFASLQTILVIEYEEKSIVFARNYSSIKLEGLGTAYVIGSGADQFLDYLNHTPVISVARNDRTPGDLSQIHYLLRYVAQTLKHQKSSGYGLERAWGGGFEIALNKNGQHMEKIDNIFFHVYTFVLIDGIPDRFYGVETRTFQHYTEDGFLIATQPGMGDVTFFLVPPPRLSRPKRPP